MERSVIVATTVLAILAIISESREMDFYQKHQLESRQMSNQLQGSFDDDWLTLNDSVLLQLCCMITWIPEKSLT